MKKTLLAFILIGIVLATSSVSALTRLNIYVDNTGQAVFLGETDDQITLPEGIYLDNGRISGKTSELTTKSGPIWTFTYTISNSELNVVLPEGAVIKLLDGGEISSYKNRISIFNEDRVEVSYSIEASDNKKREGTIFILIGVALVLITVYLTRRHHRKEAPKQEKKEKKLDKMSILSQVLNDRENLILDKLKDTGKIKMSFLRKACEIPKASFSRHIRELEKKGLVKLSGEGKNKFVSLTR